MTLDDQVRDAYAGVGDDFLDVEAAWESIAGRLDDAPRARWRVVLVAAAVLVVVAVAGGVIALTGDDPTQVTTGSDPTDTPVTNAPVTETSAVSTEPEVPGGVVQLMVLSGANPDDNDTLVRSFEEILQSEAFRAELAADTAVPAAELEVAVCRPAASAILDVEARHADPATAMLLAKAVGPTLRRIVEADQRQFPPEMRIPGPIVTELSITPRAGGAPPPACGD